MTSAKTPTRLTRIRAAIAPDLAMPPDLDLYDARWLLERLDELRAALRGLRFVSLGDCWCGLPRTGPPHPPSCLDASAALAALDEEDA
jgi:hypothetical protein